MEKLSIYQQKLGVSSISKFYTLFSSTTTILYQSYKLFLKFYDDHADLAWFGP